MGSACGRREWAGVTGRFPQSARPLGAVRLPVIKDMITDKAPLVGWSRVVRIKYDRMRK